MTSREIGDLIEAAVLAGAASGLLRIREGHRRGPDAVEFDDAEGKRWRVRVEPAGLGTGPPRPLPGEPVL